MKSCKYYVVLGFALAAFGFFLPGLAQADSFNLTADHCTGGCNPGAPGTSMGTVELTQNGTNDVLFTVTLVSPLKFVNTGLQNTFDFNIIGTPTISLGSTTNANFALSGSTADTLHFDGFGDFEYSLVLGTAQGVGGSQTSPLTFDIHSTTPLLVSDFETNGTGANVFFGVDVYNTQNGNTGPIGSGGGTTTQVPEPSSLTMLGAGILGLVGIARRRLSSAA